MSLWRGAVNNWLDKDQPNSFSDNATQYVGRDTWLPLASANESTLLHLGFGLRYSDSEEGFGTQSGLEFNRAPDYVPILPALRLRRIINTFRIPRANWGQLPN